VISRTLSGIHRLTYQEIGERTRKLASALEWLRVQKGDRVGTLAWNHHRHLEIYHAAHYLFVKDIDENDAAGMCHTSAAIGNPRESSILIEPLPFIVLHWVFYQSIVQTSK
jgi:fatty-acyl-CoA synthase